MRPPDRKHTRIGTAAQTGTPWAIILAGGEGKRMRQFTSRWLGVSRPKQYCTFLGTHSMLEQTVDRARKLVPAERIVTVIGQGHDRYLGKIHLAGRVIQQPAQKDTGPGILLPAAYILARDPEATLLIFPSDHFIFPESHFLQYVRRALPLAASTHKLVLLAAAPDRPEPDYGWIEIGSRLQGRPAGRHERSARRVLRFHEKPDAAEARDYLARGLLWNTMVMAVKARTLWSQAGQLQPQAEKRLETLLQVMQMSRRSQSGIRLDAGVPQHIFAGLPSFNFSTGFLHPKAQDCIALPMEGLLWSDWGRPERVIETIGRMRQLASLPGGLPGALELPSGGALQAQFRSTMA